jgi:thioredoxin 1
MPSVKINSFDDIKKAPIAIVDFGAEWCGPCKFIKPEFKKLADEHNGKAVFLECDIDEHQDIADKFEIQSVPTFIVFKNGNKVDTFTGADSAKLRAMVLKSIQ